MPTWLMGAPRAPITAGLLGLLLLEATAQRIDRAISGSQQLDKGVSEGDGLPAPAPVPKGKDPELWEQFLAGQVQGVEYTEELWEKFVEDELEESQPKSEEEQAWEVWLEEESYREFQAEKREGGATSRNAFTATIWKVRRCNNWLCFTSSHSRPDFAFWDWAGVSRANQKDTYLGILREPPQASTRRLVLTIAGQNGFMGVIGDGVGDRVSGSYFDWHDGWSKTTGSENHPIADNSFAHDFFDLFNLGDTFVATAWATAFDWGTSKNEKQDIEDAFYNWLRSKAVTSNLREVVIAGFSRGGCLALRLGKRFNRDLADLGVDVAVMATDPVCHVGQGEFGASSTKVTNPLNTAWEAVTTNMRSQFEREGRQLYVQTYVSGHKNFVLNNIVGLSHAIDNPAPTNTVLGGGWFRQAFITAQHTGADNWAAAMGPTVFYGLAQNWFQGTCPQPCPHGGSFDSRHCHAGSPPAGTTAFVWGSNQHFYHSPVGSSGCPMTGSYYDGANCLVLDAPDAEDPFIFANSWYYHPVFSGNHCQQQWTACLDRDDPSGSGDWETRLDYSPVPCGGSTPLWADCRTTAGASAWSTGEVLSCSAQGGLVCKNSDQSDNYCQDYCVRFLCP